MTWWKYVSFLWFSSFRKITHFFSFFIFSQYSMAESHLCTAPILCWLEKKQVRDIELVVSLPRIYFSAVTNCLTFDKWFHLRVYVGRLLFLICKIHTWPWSFIGFLLIPHKCNWTTKSSPVSTCLWTKDSEIEMKGLSWINIHCPFQQ